MLVWAFFSWWYGRGWGQVASSLRRRVRAVSESFSITLLTRTIFAPWRRIITYPGASLTERWQAFSDNAFSRVIGFCVRLLVLLAACATIGATVLITVVEIAVWPLLPLAIPVLIIVGLL